MKRINEFKNYRSGFVTLIGRPNVGKSTLMNHFIGEKISIVSNKPQTTRNKIRSILTGNDYQIVFIDTPGIHSPTTKLGNFMVKSANTALNEADAIIYMVEPRMKIHDGDKAIIKSLAGVTRPVFLAVNKVDTVDKPSLLKVIEQYSAAYKFQDIVPLSALTGENANALLEVLRKILPEGPMYFPEDQITDQPERQITAEIIREKALQYLQDEIPHGLAVEINAMKPRGEDPDSIVDVGVTIFCEKDSHKAIIIGKKGDMLKKIGSAARRDIQRLLGSPVFLDVWVKVKKNWRDNDFLLKNFGYSEKDY
ncbi:MAG: GTPase Era [Defluviitaleaceae bacterium]|nr:GTPase Era [Defluviitaleaceae bacterium]MCL2261996.1 GTPase Era [Defluviitaleaceae bacterium]